SGLSLEDFDPGSERSLTLISCLSKLLGLCVLSLLRRVMPSSTATLNLELRAQVFSEVWEAWEGSEVGACLRGDNWITVEGTRLQLKHLAAADLYRLLCNTPKHGRAHRSIALYLFGAYAPEQYQDAELRDHLFGKAFSSVREMADKHRLLPATGDIAASKQALLKALIEGEAPYGLQYDAELLPYLEFSPSDVHKVVMRTNCRKIRKGWDTLLSLAVTYPAAWPLNRLASSGIGLLIIPGYAAFQEMYNELGISMLPIQHAVKALKELHTIMRLLHCSALHWYEGREVLPQSMPELAHCLYHQCLLGRNDFGADIGAEALNRSVKLKPRVAPDEESMSWTTDAYEAIEQVELHRLWTRTAELADADSVVDFDDMSDKWFSILGSGYGKQSKLTYQDGMELNDSHNASRAQVDLIEHMHQSGELKHGLRAKRKAFAEMRETMEDLGKRNAEEQELCKFFGLDHATIITGFLKRESSSDRWLYQPTPSYDLRAQVILYPYRDTWSKASPTIAVAHSKLRSIDDVLGRVALLGGRDSRHFGGTACGDHADFSATHRRKSNQAFYATLRQVEAERWRGHPRFEERQQLLQELIAMVTNKLLVIRGEAVSKVREAGDGGAAVTTSEWTSYQLREGEFVITLDDSNPEGQAAQPDE
ncbi:unnamed protein product, partial [Symbiodinium sp. KB8]